MIFFTIESPMPLPPWAELREASGAVEPLKDLLQILPRDSLAVVLDLYPDSIHFVENTVIMVPIGLVHIFYAVTDNIIDDLLHLLRTAMTAVSGDTRFE